MVAHLFGLLFVALVESGAVEVRADDGGFLFLFTVRKVLWKVVIVVYTLFNIVPVMIPIVSLTAKTIWVHGEALEAIIDEIHTF